MCIDHITEAKRKQLEEAEKEKVRKNGVVQ